MFQLVECSPVMHKSALILVLAPQLHKLGRMVNAYNPTSQEIEAGGSEVQSQPQLHKGFKARLGYMTPGSKTVVRKRENWLWTI